MSDIVQKSYYDMNQPYVTDSLRKMVKNGEPFVISILDSIATAAPLKPFYLKNNAFWNERNRVMANNILEYIELFPSKRIVVLTGLLHKYYLIDILQQSPKKSLFNIVEFYHVSTQ